MTLTDDKPTSTEMVTTVRAGRSVLNDMAERYGMEPSPFEATVRAICMPANHTREEFAAFLLVAKEYRLNPMTKEIYAFPKKGGGIVPIVSIDGWVSLVNSHPQCDGFSFSWEQDDRGDPISCTCTMYRKDRSHPVVVTEYFAECVRPTDPWKMKHRMLRHKALIQGGRYAFGFSGIYDEDEGAKIAEVRDVTPRLSPPTPPPPPPEEPIDHEQAAVDIVAAGAEKLGIATKAEVQTAADLAGDFNDDDSGFTPEGEITPEVQGKLDVLKSSLAAQTTEADIEAAFDMLDVQSSFAGNTLAIGRAFQIKADAITALATKDHEALEAAGQGTMFPGDAPMPKAGK